MMGKYRAKPMFPAEPGGREYSNKVTPDELRQRFHELCEDVGFGEIHVEIAHGAPKTVTLLKKNVRLDLTKPRVDGIFKGETGSAHDGGGSDKT